MNIKSDAASVLPDQASLFFAHETLSISTLEVDLRDTGFALGGFQTHALEVPWSDLFAVAAFPIWPRFRIAWRHIGGVTCREYRPSGTRQCESFAASYQQLVEHIRLYRPRRVFSGWLDIPIVSWMRAESWPKQHDQVQSDYRTNAYDERLVCEATDSASFLDRLLLYLRAGSSHYHQLRGDLALSESFFYRRHEDNVFRIPRASLLSRRAPVTDARELLPPRSYASGPAIVHRVKGLTWVETCDGRIHKLTHDRVPPSEVPWAKYTFGRQLQVILPKPEDHPVARALDSQLSHETIV